MRLFRRWQILMNNGKWLQEVHVLAFPLKYYSLVVQVAALLDCQTKLLALENNASAGCSGSHARRSAARAL